MAILFDLSSCVQTDPFYAVSCCVSFYSAFFLNKWTNPGLFLFIFVLFLLQFQHKLKKA